MLIHLWIIWKNKVIDEFYKKNQENNFKLITFDRRHKLLLSLPATTRKSFYFKQILMILTTQKR